MKINIKKASNLLVFCVLSLFTVISHADNSSESYNSTFKMCGTIYRIQDGTGSGADVKIAQLVNVSPSANDYLLFPNNEKVKNILDQINGVNNVYLGCVSGTLVLSGYEGEFIAVDEILLIGQNGIFSAGN